MSKNKKKHDQKVLQEKLMSGLKTTIFTKAVYIRCVKKIFVTASVSLRLIPRKKNV